MARQKSGFLSGMGKGFEVFKAIVDAVLSLGGSDADLERVLTNKDLPTQIAQLIVGTKAAVLQFLDRTITITMDLSKTLDQLIADGKYDWVNEDIRKHFSVESGEGTKTLDIHLLHYAKDMRTDAILADMERQGLRPATFQELLWIGIQHPELQRQFPIVALGTVRQVLGDRGVAYLRRHDAERCLYLDWIGRDWHGRSRFAAVRK